MVNKLCDSDFSEDNFDLNSNISELIQEVFEKDSTDLVNKGNITTLIACLLRPLQNSSIQSFVKQPLLLSKLLALSTKTKTAVNFSEIHEQLDQAAKAIGEYLGQIVERSHQTLHSSINQPSLGRKTLQIFEILESLVGTEDKTVYQALAKYKTLASAMVCSALSAFSREVPVEQPDPRPRGQHLCPPAQSRGRESRG